MALETRYVSKHGLSLLDNNLKVKANVLLGSRLDIDLAKRRGDLVWAQDHEKREGWFDIGFLQPDQLLKIFFLDVDQGDATVIESPNGILVIDGGPNKVCHQWLMQRHNQLIQDGKQIKIDAIVITHFDTDHFEGVTDILNDPNFDIGAVYHNGLPRYKGGHGFKYKLAKRKLDGGISADISGVSSFRTLPKTRIMDTFKRFAEALLQAEQAGRVKKIERLFRKDPKAPAPKLPGFDKREPYIDVLAPLPVSSAATHPLPIFTGGTAKIVNGNSVVLSLTYGKHRFLFGADLNTASQHYLLERYAPDNPFWCNVSKACHHGSADFTIDFLSTTGAMATIFSSGDLGSYEHPMADALGAAGHYSRGPFPLVFSTELAREKNKDGEIFYGHINARSNGTDLIVAQKNESPKQGKYWHTYVLPYEGPSGED